MGLAEVLENPFMLKLKMEYVKVHGELTNLEVDYLDKHPKVESLRRRVRSLENSGRKEIKNVLQATKAEHNQLQFRKNDLEKRLADYRIADADLANRKVGYDRRGALRDQAQVAYNEVYKRWINTKMTGQIRLNNVNILDLARRTDIPIRPNMRKNLLLGIVLGLLLGVSLGFFVEFMDNTIKGREDLEQRVGLTCLGLIPTLRLGRREKRSGKLYDGKKELLVHRHPMSTIAEFSRAIRTNLMFMSPNQPLRTLLVTSPNPKEGKTTIAVNIGINIAASGKKVLLIDTDMRKPRLHTIFDASSSYGVSSYLIGEKRVVEYTQKTEIENLDILPCGSRPPNPAELLHTLRFASLLKELHEEYDTVIFDSPPVNLVTDSLLIGNQVDGVVLVAKWGKTTYHTLGHARRQLLTVNARVLGCVLNDLDLDSRSYGYYYGSPYYGYVYGGKQQEDVKGTV